MEWPTAKPSMHRSVREASGTVRRRVAGAASTRRLTKSAADLANIPRKPPADSIASTRPAWAYESPRSARIDAAAPAGRNVKSSSAKSTNMSDATSPSGARAASGISQRRRPGEARAGEQAQVNVPGMGENLAAGRVLRTRLSRADPRHHRPQPLPHLFDRVLGRLRRAAR